MSEPTEQGPKKRGPKSTYTPAKGEEICEWLAGGGSLREWCIKNKVTMQTVYRWVRDYPEMKENYARARREQSDAFVEEILRISDDPGETSTEVQASRLKIDTLKWIAGKQHPRVYGERTAVDVGGQAENPLNLADLVKKAQG